MAKFSIIPTGTSCYIHSNGWNYFYFGHSQWNHLIAHRESDRIPINEEEYEIISQQIKVPNVKNKQIHKDNSNYPTFDENKALEIIEKAIQDGSAIIETSTSIAYPTLRFVKN